MKKEDLMKVQGMTDEIAAEVEKLVAEELKGYIPKPRFDEVNDAKKNAEALVKERDKQLEDVKKASGDNEELKKQIESLQEANKATKAEYEAKIKQVQVDNAISSALVAAGAKNNAAVKALLKDLEKAEIGEDGAVKGLAEQIKALKESDAYLFTSTEAGKPAGAKPASGNGGTPNGTITKEQFAKMGYKQREELYNTNKELYDSLSK
jgi:alanyl-tRNA synthetase